MYVCIYIHIYTYMYTYIIDGLVLPLIAVDEQKRLASRVVCFDRLQENAQ